MNEWLAIMLEEIDRKKRESDAAKEETERRASGNDQPRQQEPDQETTKIGVGPLQPIENTTITRSN